MHPYDTRAVPFQVARRFQEERDAAFLRLEEATARLDQARRVLAEHARERERLQRAIAALEDDRKALSRRVRQLEQALDEARAELERHRRSDSDPEALARLEARLAEAATTRRELEAELERHRQAAERHERERQALERRLAELEARLAAAAVDSGGPDAGDCDDAGDADNGDADEARALAERYRRAAQQVGADLENLRRRLDEERARARTDERVRRLQGLLRVHDALARSLEQADDRDNPWVKGNEALLREVQAELSRAGAEAVGRPGEAFDPRLHEALATVAPNGHAPGTIVHVEQVGYRLPGGELVRPARVIVAADGE